MSRCGCHVVGGLEIVAECISFIFHFSVSFSVFITRLHYYTSLLHELHASMDIAFFLNYFSILCIWGCYVHLNINCPTFVEFAFHLFGNGSVASKEFFLVSKNSWSPKTNSLWKQRNFSVDLIDQPDCILLMLGINVCFLDKDRCALMACTRLSYQSNEESSRELNFQVYTSNDNHMIKFG